MEDRDLLACLLCLSLASLRAEVEDKGYGVLLYHKCHSKKRGMREERREKKEPSRRCITSLCTYC
jgi:hypothetical protein